MKGIFAVALLPLLAAASPVLVDTIHNEAAPLLSSVNSQVVPDSYIVVFKKHVSSASASEHHAWIQDTHHQCETMKMKRSLGSQLPITAFGGLKHTYNIVGGLLGYSGHFDESVIEQVRRHPDVSILTLISTSLGT
jgi:cerevisin